MPEYPNVVDMIFGRIDRNTDTQYKDRALAQNNNQFLIQNQREIERLKLERERQAEAARQWADQIGLARIKDTREAGQQNFSNDILVNEAIGKGLLKPISSPQEMGIKPDNIFMQNPTAIPSVEAGDPRMGPGFSYKGKQLQPTNQFDLQRMQANLLAQDETARKNKATKDYINDLMFSGMPALTATIMGHSPNAVPQITGNPEALMANLLLAGKGNEKAIHMVKEIASYLSGYKHESSRNDSMDAYHNAMAANAIAQARLHGVQADNFKSLNAGELLYRQAVSKVYNSGINSSDPRFIGALSEFITKAEVSDDIKAAAAAVATKDTQPRVLGENPFAAIVNRQMNNNNLPKPTVTATQPTAPANFSDTSRQSGSSPAQVNNKPATVTGPPGVVGNRPTEGPLKYTQPNQQPVAPIAMPTPNSQGLVPIYRNDGSIDGHVTPEQWQELNAPAQPMFSNPFTGLNQWMIERQRKQAVDRQRQYNFNNQGFGYRPQNY